MGKKNIKYKFLSWVLLCLMLPSLVGVNILKHHCFSCDEYETVTALVNIEFDHHHDRLHSESTTCCSCDMSSCCETDHKHKDHLKGKGCSEEYKRIEVNSTVFNSMHKIKIAELDLFNGANFMSIGSYFTDSKECYSYQDIILYVPDEPSLVKNCVFLL